MLTKNSKRLLAFLVALVLVAAACSDDSGDDEAADGDGETAGGGGEVLASVTDANVIRCGTRDALPGFAVLQDDGSHQGFDSDFCRVIAAAVLGDAEAVEHVDLETDDRFTALQSGEVDVLVRNTTWTASRDGVEGATFLQPNFYDGQGMMVAAGSYESVDDMGGTVICVASGTTTEGNVASEFSRRGLEVEVLSFENTDLIQEAFIGGRCDGWSADRSQLTGLRSAFPDGPDSLTILPATFSKEPLAPAVRDGDAAWAAAVEWAVFATIQAEEWGITSENVDSFLESDDPNIQRFLGVEVDGAVLDPGLGLPADYAYQVVKQVGNYGEIFDRHLTPLGLERGVNSLWLDGGLLYAPPYK
ncbi:MAG: transporter substrate-binding domain-containing protein [Acidimicrobiia bacterium]|nr:transporter substrate-binding domain-containing protein [Acidimicrobiia bacterium]